MTSAAAALGSQGSAQSVPADHDHTLHSHPKPTHPLVPRLPALLCAQTGTIGIDAAFEMLKLGSDTLDAALHVAKIQEDDPNDYSTGLGGLPNEACEVQLDACCLHGPTRRGATAGAVSRIKNASLLARTVMEETGYTSLVGQDAQRFAMDRGFPSEELITERTRRMWKVWEKIQTHQELPGDGIVDPNWPAAFRKAHFLPASQQALNQLIHRLEPLAAHAGLGPQFTWRAIYDALLPVSTPLYVSTVNQKEEMSSVATTSGVPWRLAGATSDIAMIGAGCYLDPEIGSAGSTGSAEANIKIAGARTIVENMRRGMSPEEAGMDALHRIVHWYGGDMTALRFVEMVYYVLRKDGAYAGLSLWRGDRTGNLRQFTIHDGSRRTEECKFLFDGNPTNGVRA